jgi:hypothetical protein
MADTEIVSPLQQLRDGMALIREAIEEHVPIGGLEAQEYSGVEPLEEVAALVRAIHAIAEKPGRRRLRFEKDEDWKNGWSVYSGGLLVATIEFDDDKIYEPDKPWIWRTQDINAGPDIMETLGYETSLEDAKKAIAQNFKLWVAWAEL